MADPNTETWEPTLGAKRTAQERAESEKLLRQADQSILKAQRELARLRQATRRYKEREDGTDRTR